MIQPQLRKSNNSSSYKNFFLIIKFVICHNNFPMSMARYAFETSLPLMHLVRGENPLKPVKITMAIIFS